MDLVTLTRIFGDDQGETHFARIDLPERRGTDDVGPPRRLGIGDIPATTFDVSQLLEPKVDRGIHTPLRRQMVVVLRGVLEVITSTGDRRRFHAGDCLLADDLDSKGHTTRQVGIDPLSTMAIGIPNDWELPASDEDLSRDEHGDARSGDQVQTVPPAGFEAASQQPRVPPLGPSEHHPEADELLAKAGDRASLNIFRTMVRHPRVFKRWVPFGHILLNGTLPPRDRELLILRTAYRCGSVYEWAHHEQIARECDLDESEIDRVREGADAGGWTPFDAALLRAVDELLDRHWISDATWAALAERYDERLLIELPMVVGHYHMLAVTLNSLGVAPDEVD